MGAISLAHKKEAGKLYVVATPIGNLADITERAKEVFISVEAILCESASETKKLLHKLGISKQTWPLYKDSSAKPYHSLLTGLQEGQSYALVSDAGTPGISDPGSHIVRVVRENGFGIVPVPGASALSAILSVSGFQVNPTFFLGFLSEKPSKKRKELEEAGKIDGLIVFYESVHKLPRLYPLLVELFPNSEILMGRELTKTFEELAYYPNPSALLENPPIAKGEFVFLINHRKKMLKGISENTDT